MSKNYSKEALKRHYSPKACEEQPLPKSVLLGTFSKQKKEKQINQRISEEANSTKKTEKNVSLKNRWRQASTVLWREIPTKQISEETSTKEYLNCWFLF